MNDSGTAIPPEVVADILRRSRYRCCLCVALKHDYAGKNGRVVHLDRNCSNHATDNLAFLCVEHSDGYPSRDGQPEGLTIDEIKRHRAALIATVEKAYPSTWKGLSAAVVLIPFVLLGWWIFPRLGPVTDLVTFTDSPKGHVVISARRTLRSPLLTLTFDGASTLTCQSGAAYRLSAVSEDGLKRRFRVDGKLMADSPLACSYTSDTSVRLLSVSADDE
jgi:hypothetical protein